MRSAQDILAEINAADAIAAVTAFLDLVAKK